MNSTGTVSELLSANWSIVDSTLAPIYGVTSAGRDSAHDVAEALRHPEPGGVPVGVRARAGDGARASRRRGHAPGRVHEHARSDVAEHRRRAPGPRSGEVDARSHSTSTRPTPRAPPATPPSTRSASRSRCSTAWARSARRARWRARTRTSTSGRNGALTSVNTTARHHRRRQRVPQRLRGRLRRQQRAGDGARATAPRCASAWPGRCSGRRRAVAATRC